MVTAINTAVTETASEILGKHGQKEKKKKKKTGSLQSFLICATKRERTEKETILTGRIREIPGSEQQHQEVKQENKRKLDTRTV